MVRPNLKFFQLLKIKANCLKQEIQNKFSNNYVMLNLVNIYIYTYMYACISIKIGFNFKGIIDDYNFDVNCSGLMFLLFTIHVLSPMSSKYLCYMTWQQQADCLCFPLTVLQTIPLYGVEIKVQEVLVMSRICQTMRASLVAQLQLIHACELEQQNLIHLANEC